MGVAGKAFTGLTLATVSAATLLSVSLFQSQPSNLELYAPTREQLTWNDAARRCGELNGNWRLPSIIELLALNYRDNRHPFISDTDYWSRNSYLGYAFGLNTHRGITSFDRHADTDHFICVRKTKRPA